MYNHRQIEKKWIQKWSEKFVDYSVDDTRSAGKKYILVEFPFPSGAGLHVGHIRSYVAQDIKARMYRMQGYKVLYPMGWDAFGLPTEQYAIKHSIHPAVATQENISNFKQQLSVLGLSFDWSREINTTDPSYYRWTQFIWLKMFQAGLAYQDMTEVWWCEELKTVLANEEVIDGRSERGDYPCQRVPLTQWMLAITQYANRLDKDLDTVDYLPVIKTQQRNWIGKSQGVQLKFQVQDSVGTIEVYTTRIDTLFGVTFLVLAPEHPLLEKIVKDECRQAVYTYQQQTQTKSELERQQERQKSGAFTGAYAVHPISLELIPIWVADYVLMNYGTGAVMAVPAHDERDREFAEKFQLKQIRVLSEDNRLENSGIYNGLSSKQAQLQLSQDLESRQVAYLKTQYKLRDWVFSRQRYWGEPFPVVWLSEHDYFRIQGEIQSYLPERPIIRDKDQRVEYAAPLHPGDLPLELPVIDSYIPQGRGEGPLAQNQDWVEVWYHLSSGKTIPRSQARPDDNWVRGLRETDTMPNWAGSSWYYLRYLDPQNNKALADFDQLQTWLPVDIYNGGMEHVTLHLLYSRFWHKFLYDIGLVPTIEPYQKRIAHGMILAEGGVKMSKSKGNTIDPMEMVEAFGADSLRLYEMFMGPYDEAIAWDTKGLIGCNRFLKKLYQWVENHRSISLQSEITTSSQLDYDTHSLIKKITEDIEKSKYNTCVSSFMEYVNLYSVELIPLPYVQILIQLMAPFTPHIAEELWEMLGQKDSVHLSRWPVYASNKLTKNSLKYQIHINGKMSSTLELASNLSEQEIYSQLEQSEIWLKYKIDMAQAKIIIKPSKQIIIVIWQK